MKLNWHRTDEIKFLSSILSNHKRRIITIMGLLFVIAGCNAALPQLSITIIDEGFMKQDTHLVIANSIIIFSIYAIITTVYVFVEKLRLTGYNSIQTELKEKCLFKLNSIKIDFFNEQSATSVFQQLDEDINAISGCFSSEILLSFVQIAISIVLFPILFGISWKLTVILIVAIPINMLKSIILSKIGYRYSKKRVQVKKDYSQWISEVILGAQVIRCFIPIGNLQRTFQVKQSQVATAQYKHYLFQETTVRLEGLFVEFLLMFFYIFGGYYVTGGELSLGQFIAFQTYSLSLLNIIGDFLNVVYGYSTIKPSIERFIEFEKGENEEAGFKSIQNPETDLTIENLTFCYTGQEKVIENVSLSFPFGKKIGIKGGNGTGKTTLINLLLRFYSPVSGAIRLGEENIDNFKIDEYRNLFSIVPQKPFLFCDTIRNNISLYRDVDDEILLDVINMVGLSDLVKDKSLDFCVGQDGCELSGGQRQRVSIARALVRNSPFIILDEPETNLDSEFRVALKRILEERFKKRTIIMITHDEELLEQMDYIYTLKKVSYENCDNR